MEEGVMREIKFRAWDKNTKEYRDVVFDTSDYRFGFIIEHDGTLDSDMFIWEQYTGLKDKNRNGAEVYQGDIYIWCGLTFPITIDDYHGYRFMFGKDQLVRAYIENGKYIGNIHESPTTSKPTAQ